MFDPAWLVSDRPSAVETTLCRLLEARHHPGPGVTLVTPRWDVDIDLPPRGASHAPPSLLLSRGPAAAEPPAADAPRSDHESVARLLAAGASALEIAAAQQAIVDVALAARTRALASFARWRPTAALDRQPGEVGAACAATRAARPAVLTEVSEWAVDEVSIALSVSRSHATGLLAQALTLAERLPATLTAVSAGKLGFDQARVLAELLGPLPDDLRAQLEVRLLARAPGKTVAQLRAAARPAGAARRRRRRRRPRGGRDPRPRGRRLSRHRRHGHPDQRAPRPARPGLP